MLSTMILYHSPQLYQAFVSTRSARLRILVLKKVRSGLVILPEILGRKWSPPAELGNIHHLFRHDNRLGTSREALVILLHIIAVEADLSNSVLCRCSAEIEYRASLLPVQKEAEDVIPSAGNQGGRMPQLALSISLMLQ